MALIKEHTTPQGVTALYHKIIKAEIQPLTQLVEVVVAVFATAEARDAGAQTLWHEYVRIPFDALTQDPRDLLYPMLSAYIGSYLAGGVADQEGNGAPGNFTISLKPEVIVQPE